MTRMPNLYPYFMENCSRLIIHVLVAQKYTYTHTHSRSFFVNEWMNEWTSWMETKEWKTKRKTSRQYTHTHDVSRVFRNRRRVQWHTHHVHVCFVFAFQHISIIASLHFTLHRLTSSHLTSLHFAFLFGWLSLEGRSVVTDFRLEFTWICSDFRAYFRGERLNKICEPFQRIHI